MLKFKDPEIPLSYAIEQFKDQADMAAHLGVTKALVSQWKGYDYHLVPFLHAYRLMQIKPKAFKQFK